MVKSKEAISLEARKTIIALQKNKSATKRVHYLATKLMAKYIQMKRWFLFKIFHFSFFLILKKKGHICCAELSLFYLNINCYIQIFLFQAMIRKTKQIKLDNPKRMILLFCVPQIWPTAELYDKRDNFN